MHVFTTAKYFTPSPVFYSYMDNASQAIKCKMHFCYLESRPYTVGLGFLNNLQIYQIKILIEYLEKL